MISLAIAKAYYRRIHRGEITIEDVPEKMKEQVQALLDEDNKTE